MLYAIISEDVQNSLPLRLPARPQHLERLKQLKLEGRLVLAGPFPVIVSENSGEAGFTGSLIVASFDSLDEAEQWAESDPYKAAGVYHNIVVKPFNKVFP